MERRNKIVKLHACVPKRTPACRHGLKGHGFPNVRNKHNAPACRQAGNPAQREATSPFGLRGFTRIPPRAYARGLLRSRVTWVRGGNRRNRGVRGIFFSTFFLCFFLLLYFLYSL
ncbi:hypothetical protein COU79_00120 [Candidatus Peregrinibacteria bacterium CG10_big_fil_rev_8_21_14_0_10_54_7]|nr:MAG: hypothetical protein COU79_00120 [Candidatus Peregrinibacteria bacterium CG10_big_fil_rev_8_21_14_0_10_54_7]